MKSFLVRYVDVCYIFDAHKTKLQTDMCLCMKEQLYHEDL